MRKQIVILIVIIFTVTLNTNICLGKPRIHNKKKSLLKVASSDLEVVDGNRIYNYINN